MVEELCAQNGYRLRNEVETCNFFVYLSRVGESEPCMSFRQPDLERKVQAYFRLPEKLRKIEEDYWKAGEKRSAAGRSKSFSIEQTDLLKRLPVGVYVTKALLDSSYYFSVNIGIPRIPSFGLLLKERKFDILKGKGISYEHYISVVFKTLEDMAEFLYYAKPSSISVAKESLEKAHQTLQKLSLKANLNTLEEEKLRNAKDLIFWYQRLEETVSSFLKEVENDS